MREFFKITLIATAILVAFTACRNNEDELTPSGNYSPIRGGFPQDTTEYDSIILDIKNEYGVYLLYKDVSEEDMNRTWVSAGTGDIYVAGNPEDREDGTWDLPAEQLPLYVDFFRNYIFPNIDKAFAHSTFPVKIYMINNLRTEPRKFSDEEEGENSEGDNTQQGTDANPNKVIKLGDFDNWAISFSDDIINGSDTENALKQQRCIFMIQAINNAIEKGDLFSGSNPYAGAEDGVAEDKGIVLDLRNNPGGILDEGVKIADSLLGEITPAMAAAIGSSDAYKILLPVNKCHNIVIGTGGKTTSELIGEAIEKIKEICENC